MQKQQEIEVGLAILDRINDQIIDLLTKHKKKSAVRIFDHLDSNNIVFFNEQSRDSALQSLVAALSSSGVLEEKDQFFKAILEREKVVSTAIGKGVAIPHAKMEGLDQFFIAIGVQKNKGLHWNSPDDLPVRLIFMIGGPESDEYLKILSKLTDVIKSESIRKKIINASSSKEIVALFEGY